MDFNNDGKVDILSGCYWITDPPKPRAEAAHLQLLMSEGGNNFSKSLTIKTSSDAPLLNVPHKQTKTIDERKYVMDNISIHPFAADIDDDGDLDLIVGNFLDKLYLHENIGTAEKPIFENYGLLVATVPNHQSTSPFLCDWDVDGDLDILTGGSPGTVFISFNEGDKKNPKWKKFTKLLSPASVNDSHSKLCVEDWNEDGKLDIIVGYKSGEIRIFLQK